MKNQDFLAYLDQKHSLAAERVNNKGYIDYTRINTNDIKINKRNEFYFAKKLKTRIILKHDNIWVDFTDADLISIISGFANNLFDLLLNDFRLGIIDQWSEFNFEIDGTEYCGKAIDYSSYGEDSIDLPMDFDLKIKELLFIINLIINKDIVGQKYIAHDKKTILVQQTLRKYISLSLYFRNKNKSAEEYLNRIHYPIDKIELYLQKKVNLKKYDHSFSEDGFEKLVEV